MKKTIDKAEFLKEINRDIKIMSKELKKSSHQTYSYNAGELNTMEWIRDWVKADLGEEWLRDLEDVL